MADSDDFSSKRYSPKTKDAMKDVLMAPDAEGPAVLYHMVRGGKDLKNITIWEAGTIGGEYIKTYGHYHVGDYCETYWILWGQGIVILQKRASDTLAKPIDEDIEEIKVFKVKAPDIVFMPKGWAHAIINTGKTLLVTQDDTDVSFSDKGPDLANCADYEPIRKMRGMAYYIVEKNGEPQIIQNPLYKRVPQTSILKYDPSLAKTD